MKLPIYLDHQATTPCDPRVVEAMSGYWSLDFGNPASRTHAFGRRAEEAVEHARAAVATLIGATSREIVFTSGATEANNLALLGLARAFRHDRRHLITCVTEHRAVLDPCAALEREGFRVTVLPTGADGLLSPDSLRAALEPETLLVSVMHANNETGVVQPLAELARITHEAGAVLHSDAAQSVGKLPVDVAALGVDLLSLSGHKLYGPKGVGALYVRRRRPPLRLEPLLHGGGHERGLRSGTLPVPLCVGLGEACRLAVAELVGDGARILGLRRRLWELLSGELEGVELNGHRDARLPGNLNVSFRGIEAQALLVGLPGVALSTGSSCTSAKPEPSHVLRGMGLGQTRSRSAVRFGIGRPNTLGEIEEAARLVIAEVERIRARS